MMRWVLGVVTGAAMTMGLSVSAGAQQISPFSDWITLGPQGEHFSLSAPAEWHSGMASGKNGKLQVDSGPKGSFGRAGSAKCSVTVRSEPSLRGSRQEDLDSEVRTSEFVKTELENGATAVFSNAHILSSEPRPMGGRVAYIISITGNYETFDVKMALHMFMVTYFTPGTVYALACSASGLDANEADAAWRDWGAVLKHVATTFRVELD